ncbi:hypothetical protein OKW24_001842 [Peribacillus simplex]|uniref:hypothetical protein n=1 Tax=Peribacillus simplex TaxID=1478 RepID=UPI0024E244B7|nr:hypothetical protein [Peribacillus simplex]MDF9760069.1 hypothetical protein [Peribacillus simplex]
MQQTIHFYMYLRSKRKYIKSIHNRKIPTIVTMGPGCKNASEYSIFAGVIRNETVLMLESQSKTPEKLRLLEFQQSVGMSISTNADFQ